MSPDDAAREMMELFDGNSDAYGTHGVPTQKGLKWEIKDTARTPREPLTLKLWKQHLAGTIPLGVIPIKKDNTCKWGSIDVDDYITDLLGLIDRCERAHLPLVPCRSKSGGLHLFMFLANPCPAVLLQTALKNLAAQLGVAGSEIFPKQTQVLTERGDVGNWMVMPYYGDTYGGKLREQVGLKKTGAELTIEEFIKAVKAARIGADALSKWQAITPPVSRGSGPTRLLGPPSEPFADGPVCLQILAKEKVPLGGQNNALLNMGSYYKRKNPVAWKDDLDKANREYLTPPGSSEGLVSVVRSLEKKDYEYTCKIEPICSYCNASLCRTRKYGVGDGTSSIDISGLSKLNADPPIWFVDVGGDKRLEISTDDILYYNRFIRVCFERLDTVLPMIKQDTWMSVLRPLMDNCTIIETTKEVSKTGHFMELLDEFCTNRRRGKNKEDLLAGMPWEDEENQRYYFQLKDFQKFLNREKITEWTRGQITQKIRHAEGGVKFMNLKKKGINAWFVPSSVFELREKLDLPKMEGSVI